MMSVTSLLGLTPEDLKSIRPSAWATFAVGAFCLLNYWVPLVPLQERALFAALVAPALFLVTKPDTPHAFWRRTDLPHALLSMVAFGYIVSEWYDILLRQGAPNPADIWLGVLAVYLLVVSAMRNQGIGFTLFIGLFLLYTFFGYLLPNWAGGHRGYSNERIFTFLFLSENGILGFTIDTCLKFMFLFLLMGKCLEYSGALRFIMDLGAAMFPRGATGPPMMSIVTSGLIGTVSGSSMTNVYISGTVTIPLMKRVGLSPEVSAAIECAASNGSQIMPPVMGFAVFFMVVLLQISYAEIALAAAIPGTLYFVSLGFSVWLRTRHLTVPEGLEVIGAVPPLRQVLWSLGAFSFFGTLGALVGFMVVNIPIQSAVIYATALCIVASWFGPNRIGPVQIVKAIESAGRDLVPIAVLCLGLGLITAPILLTGLGTKLPTLLIDWADGNLWILLIAAFVASLIMGTGLPTSTVYIIVALLIGNAVAQFGVPKLAAHLFVFYAALAASITPPVAMTAYVSATIAQANFWKTGWIASFLGLPKYVLPFGFIYRPELLMMGGFVEIVGVTALTTAGLFAMSYGGYLWRLGLAGRLAGAVMALSGFLMVVPKVDATLLTAIAISLAIAMTLRAVALRVASRPI